MSTLLAQMRYLNPYDIHKLLINDYVLRKPGDTKLFKRDSSKDRNDYHVIKENHKFLWDESETPESWELQFAKRYYDKLFKEYCIGDLCLYKENKIALRWRKENEVITGKGQFICANKTCDEKENLRTWEVNFGYTEKGKKKNALVKIRLCPNCSKKLNYCSRKREIKRLRKKTSKSKYEKGKTMHSKAGELSSSSNITLEAEVPDNTEISEADHTEPETVGSNDSPWENHKPIEAKSREEEMEEYLQDLLL